MTDAELIAASVGDPAAFGAVFDRHGTTLHRYLMRRVGASEADGLLGEVFRIAFERRGPPAAGGDTPAGTLARR